MKFSFKQVVTVLIAFVIGILMSETITDELLVIEKVRQALESSTLWTPMSAIASFTAAGIALYVAIIGWKKAEKARQEDKEEAERIKKYDYWIQQALDADIAYLHFHHLSRNARSVAYTKFGTPEFSKIKFQEVYDAWGASLLNERFSASIIAFRNWSNSSFTDDMEIRLNALVAYHYNSPNPPFEYALHAWQDITILLELASEISYLRLHECRSKANAIYNHSQDSDSLKAVKETKKEIESLIQQYAKSELSQK